MKDGPKSTYYNVHASACASMCMFACSVYFVFVFIVKCLMLCLCGLTYVVIH